MAHLGIGLLIIAQKPWAVTTAEIAAYGERYLELNGDALAPSPMKV